MGRELPTTYLPIGQAWLATAARNYKSLIWLSTPNLSNENFVSGKTRTAKQIEKKGQAFLPVSVKCNDEGVL